MVTGAPMAPSPYVTREAWLRTLVEQVTPWYEDLGLTVPPVRVGVGFTSKGARSNRIGECWSPTCSGDGTVEVYVHPKLRDPVEVAGVLVHELIHACVGTEAKHGSQFRRPALALGLTGRMTATVPGPELVARLATVTGDLGPYPHGGLTARTATSAGPKQTTRMVKCECPECGYLLRTTRKWIEVAVPECPVDRTPMAVA